MDDLLSRIAEGKVHMRSRFRFVLSSVFFGVLLIGIIVCAVFLTSFTIAFLRASGAATLPEFGTRGFGILLHAVPWTLIGTGTILVLAAAALSHRLPAAYRRPLVVSVAVIAFGVGTLAVLIAFTPTHRYLRSHAGRVPVLGPFYRSHRFDRIRGMHIGTIATVSADRLTIETRGGAIVVFLDEETQRPPQSALAIGKRVVVIGDRTASGVHAYGVRPLDTEALEW